MPMPHLQLLSCSWLPALEADPLLSSLQQRCFRGCAAVMCSYLHCRMCSYLHCSNESPATLSPPLSPVLAGVRHLSVVNVVLMY